MTPGTSMRRQFRPLGYLLLRPLRRASRSSAATDMPVKAIEPLYPFQYRSEVGTSGLVHIDWSL